LSSIRKISKQKTEKQEEEKKGKETYLAEAHLAWPSNRPDPSGQIPLRGVVVYLRSSSSSVELLMPFIGAAASSDAAAPRRL
jgi:hypothetical protein